MPPDSDDTAAPASWRERITVHPAADLFPGISDAELRQLGEDIKTNGLRVPLVLVGDGRLIDGRNRLDAMERVGVPIFDNLGELALPFETAEDADPLLYVISANFHRRHLTPEQRDELVQKLKADRPELSIRAIAVATRTSKSKVGRALQRSGVPDGTPELVTGRDGKRYPAKAKTTPKAKTPPVQVRDKAIVGFSVLLHQKPLNTLEDLNRILRDERHQIAALPLVKRRALAQGYLTALNIDPNDLRPDAGEHDQTWHAQ
jgi:hypothetical protein